VVHAEVDVSRRRNLLAIVGPLGILLVAAWLDASFLVELRLRAASTFDPSATYPLYMLCVIALGGACVLIGRLGSRAAPLVGFSYVIVGAFLAGLEWFAVGLSPSGDGGSWAIPEAASRAMARLFLRTTGPLHAVAIIGGAMVVTGVVCLVRWLRARRATPASTPAEDAALA
jgi:hypothetical protein